MDCEHYVSDVFDSSTGIWWRCDDDNNIELSDLPEGVYYRETHKPTKKNRLIMGSSKVRLVVYIRTSYLTKHSYTFFEETKILTKTTIVKELIDEKKVFRSEIMVRREVNDEIQRTISFIKDAL